MCPGNGCKYFGSHGVYECELMMVKLMWKLVVSASEPIILVNYYDCRGVASLRAWV
jgi:hypothetical protein